jgi:hypothetical protein
LQANHTKEMQNLIIKTNEDEFYKPEVNFDSENGICTIAGESYIEEIHEFYNPLIDWLRQYTADNNNSLIFNFKLTYYNTSSSKKIIEILKILKNFKTGGGKLTINWFYHEKDTDIIEDAEDFMLISGLQFNLIQIENN